MMIVKLLYIFLQIIIFFILGICDPSIKQLHIIFRHGERSPTETYQNDPYINYSWSGGWGQLTNRGKYQMYALGVKLRELYKNVLPDYYFHKDVEILSSYYDRCLMSAQVLLAGLYPPKGELIWNNDFLWQPIPVKYTPRLQDNLIVMRAKCTKYDQQLTEVFSSDYIKKIDQDNRELYDYLSKYTGSGINNIKDVEKLYNTLEIELLHNLTLPAWAETVSLKRMKELAATCLATFTWTPEMKRLKGGVFLNRTLAAMRTGAERSQILYLYSGHDVTLVNVLRTLSVVDDNLKPDFGASLVIELHNDSTIRMIYRNGVNDDPQQFTVEGCRAPCLLDDFQSRLEGMLPGNWEDECRL